MNKVVHQVTRFVFLVVLQSYLFSHILLFQFGLGFVHLFFILFMPLRWPYWLQLVIAFLLGFTIDVLSGTSGLHTITATTVVPVRIVLLRFILPKYSEEEWETINLFNRSMLEFCMYALLASFWYSLVFFAVDFFSFKAFPRIIYHVLLSTLFSLVLLFIYRYIFAKSEKAKD